jgi:hypothetical protein
VTAFVMDRRACRRGAVHLLPTAAVVMVFSKARPPVLVTPHRDVRAMHDVTECVSLTPNVLKCLLGEPRRLLELTLSTDAHVMLSPFADCRSLTHAAPLLEDLRRSLVVTPDERDFLDLWRDWRKDPESLPTSDRWVQRLCLRYAGQPAKRLKGLARLSATLMADVERGLHNSLGLFADASHYARVCRANTGHPPGQWRRLSQPFC